jgi:hypothetical protein
MRYHPITRKPTREEVQRLEDQQFARIVAEAETIGMRLRT